MSKKHRKPREGSPTYTPDQVAEAFTAIRDNLDMIEVAYQEAIEVQAQPTFKVWDATSPGYLEAQGLPRCKTPPESGFYPNDSRRPPDLEFVRNEAAPNYAEFDPLAIDIECYGKQESGDAYKYMPEEIEWLRQIVEVMQEENPQQRVGIYMTPPERYGGCSPYTDFNHPECQQRWNAWTERNKLMLPLAKQVDVFFPSLYGLYSNMDQWVRFAKQNVEQTRMLDRNKPLIGFIWPTWHNNAEKEGPISYDDWTIMLETCLEVCDGVAIWDYSSERFDPSEPWWKATEDFMKKHHLNGR